MVFSLTMEILLPSAMDSSPPLHSACLILLAKLISAKWRYFFPGNVLDTILDQSKRPKIQHEDVLSKVYKIMIDELVIGQNFF